MKPPTDKEVYDKQGAIFWMDDDGILNAIGKNVPRTLNMMKANGEFLKTLLNGRKVCCLYDNSSSGSMDDESRSYVKKEMENLYKAVAIVTHSSIGKML